MQAPVQLQRFDRQLPRQSEYRPSGGPAPHTPCSRFDASTSLPAGAAVVQRQQPFGQPIGEPRFEECHRHQVDSRFGDSVLVGDALIRRDRVWIKRCASELESPSK